MFAIGNYRTVEQGQSEVATKTSQANQDVTTV